MIGIKTENYSKMIGTAFRKNAVSKIISAESGTIATVIDSIIISKYLGLDAMGSYGIAIPVVYLVIAFSKLLSDGGARQCGLSIGQGDKKKSDAFFTTTILYAVFLSILLMSVILFAPNLVAKILGANGNANAYLDGATEFLRGYAFGIPGHILLLSFIPFAQLDGKLSYVSFAGYTMAIVDVILDLANVYIFHYGLFGMALATSISEYVGAIILLISLLNKDCEFKFSLRSFKPKYIFLIRWSGVPGFFSYFFTSIRSIVSNYVIAAFLPLYILPIFSGISSLMNLFYPIGKGIGSTVMVMSSVFYGEEDTKILKQIYKTSNIYTIAINFVLTILIIAFAPYLLQIFLTVSTQEMLIATHGARLMALSLIPFSIHTIFRSYMQGIGRIFQTTLFLGIYECVISTLCAYTLSSCYSVEGFWVSFIIREIITLLLALIFIVVLNMANGNKLPLKDAGLMVYDGFNIKENEIFELSVYSNDELQELNNKLDIFLLAFSSTDNKVKMIKECFENATISVFNRKFEASDVPELRVRIYKKLDTWNLRFRDNGERFDPTQQADTFSNFNSSYIRLLNQNVMFMQLKDDC